MKILLELRPAFDGHAGIPQETRLLFRGLGTLEGLCVEGLLQSSNRVLARGLRPDGGGRLSTDRRIHQLSRVVISTQQAVPKRALERSLQRASQVATLALMTLGSLVGRTQRLGLFDPTLFRDFIWRDLFARTLPIDDLAQVTAAGYRVARVPWNAMHASGLMLRRLGLAGYPRLDTRGFDAMIAETPYPGMVSPGTQLVVRYHDAIPVLMPHTITDKGFHEAAHYHALRLNVDQGAWFACVSEATRRDLLAMFPELAPRAVTIPNMVSHHYWPQACTPGRLGDIVRVRRSTLVRAAPAALVDEPADYLLMVSTLEPRKNHGTLLAAWEQLRAEHFPQLRLIFVGSPGWDHAPIVQRMKPWLERGDVHLLEDVPAPELRLLYHHARATVCPSYGEGFDFSGVEAMRCGGAVVASDIPVHRDVYGDAAEYFNTYSPTDLADTLCRLIDPFSDEALVRRSGLVERGETVSATYGPERVLPLWRAFLQGLPGSGR